MNKLNSTVEVSVGNETICLHLALLSFSSMLLDITKEQLQFISDCNEGKLIGLTFFLKFNCNDNGPEMHSKIYSAKCSASFRLSANKYSLRFVFIDLDDNQYSEIRKTIPRMC